MPCADSPSVQGDLDFCWEQATGGDPWFRLHFTFAPRALAKQILALHALFAMLERATAMSEESLALAQLGWWQAELSPQGVQASAHPVVRALRNLGATETITPEVLHSLVARSFDLSVRARPTSLNEFKQLCSRVGEARVRSQLSLASKAAADTQLEGHCAATGLSRILALASQGSAGMWFVPLDMQARFQGGTTETRPDSPEGRALVEALAEMAEDWYREQVGTVQRMIAESGSGSSAFHHQFALMASERLRVQRNLQNLAKGGAAESRHWRLGDLFKIWFESRRMSRRSGAD